MYPLNFLLLIPPRPNGNKPDDIHIRNKKTNSKNIGNAIGLDKVVDVGKKIAGEQLNSKVFDLLCDQVPGLELLRGPGMQIGTGLIIGLLDHMKKNSPINKNGDPINIASSKEILGLGVNSHIHKIKIFLGHKLTPKLKRNLNYRACNKEEKELSNSRKDYIEANKRKYLSIKTGFGQKSFNFLGSDITLTVGDVAQIISSGSGIDRIEKSVSNEHGIQDSYGCICKTFRKVIMTNRMSGYSAKIKIHLFAA